MAPADRDVRAPASSIRQRAEDERQRASYCDARATRHEMHAATGAKSLSAMHLRLADLYSGAASRHLAAAELHELLADRMQALGDSTTDGTRSVLMTAVTDVLRSDSALATLVASGRAPAFVAASDATARASHDLEMVMAEGPVTDATKGAAVVTAGPDLLDRWPRYGPAAAQIGIYAVRAAPLGVAGVRLGALCALGRAPESPAGAASIGLMADALTRVLLAHSDIAGPDQELSASTLLGEADAQAIVHQAVGIISVQCCCGLNDAADLLAARAFADGKPLAEIAHQVVQGQQLFQIG